MMLSNVNMLYLGSTVLVQLDLSYLNRFWTMLEAWLSFMMPSDDGLLGATAGKGRCTIECMNDRTLPAHVQVLKDMLSMATADKAFAYLCDDAIQVTNQSDKTLQLPKIKQFHQAVMEHMQHLSADRLRTQLAEASSSRPSSARRLPLPEGDALVGAAKPMSLAEKVGKIKQALLLDESLPMPVAIKQANENMGLPATGTLPTQADALLVALGV